MWSSKLQIICDNMYCDCRIATQQRTDQVTSIDIRFSTETPQCLWSDTNLIRVSRLRSVHILRKRIVMWKRIRYAQEIAMMYNSEEFAVTNCHVYHQNLKTIVSGWEEAISFWSVKHQDIFQVMSMSVSGLIGMNLVLRFIHIELIAIARFPQRYLLLNK